MNIKEAMLSLKPFRIKDTQNEAIQYFKQGTGPFRDLVICDYFTIDGDLSTSLDLYPEELLSENWEILEEK